MESDPKDPVAAFLNQHPLTSKWLDDIVDVLQRTHPRGTAHVREIARQLWGERDIESIEETVTRRINDFCSDAADFKKSKEHDLFERVEPATYRLRSYPDRPNTIELIHITFQDMTMQGVWEWFVQIAKTRSHSWNDLSNYRKLEAFAKNMTDGKYLRSEYERRKKQSMEDLDFDLDGL